MKYLFIAFIFSITAVAFSTAIKAEDAPKAGVVTPLPAGCIYFAYYDAGGEQPVVRNARGEITHIISPIKRNESLVRRWSIDEITKEIAKGEKRDFRIPTSDAWTLLQKSVKSGDEIWSFGALDAGVAIIRKQKVVCVVVTSHCM